MLLTAGVISLIFSLVLTPSFVKLFRKLEWGQFIRDDGPRSHHVKRGLPTMGGIIFVLATLVGVFGSALIFRSTVPVSVLLVLFMMVGMAFVGFLDDFLKVHKKRSLGLTEWPKVIGQAAVGTAFALLAVFYRDESGTPAATQAVSLDRDIPWANFAQWTAVPAIGLILYLIWVNLLAISATNGVNLADGLDGLATGAAIFSLSAYVLIGVWQFNQSCFSAAIAPENLSACYTSQSPLGLATAAAALCGALIGFLWWNTNPAKIIMGDTGALGIGGAIAALAILTRTELLLILVGGLFVMETASVLIQRGYFKATHGRRVFRMAPIHHHFELKGWPEVTIVVRFWSIMAVCNAVAIGVFYALWVAR
ncbi:phospho-N-acetylmuramoyl-pentapeptide-transferase [Spelaeicoccus albus]|uniref:Phospho-N-acetylmuramoyl-pentapeptide-transferase n=2 Tax=Spelaeicoccus albus TaxID=1280376 RepID=A0A7Z0D269_9MICO|nr:phospho-N-acetylmuramoyl-pentapeptide-transferase [Spelaeicoccus albus]NYI67510.1 phospho-N-acetylmuramoyl-pentapeptide-transferase [Spelaeicoccus albus]